MLAALICFLTHKICLFIIYLLFIFSVLGCEAALSAKSQGIDKISKSSSGYLPDLTHGVNSSFYEFQCNDKNGGVQNEQYAEHFYEQPMVVFPAKHFSTAEVLEKSPFLTNSICGSGIDETLSISSTSHQVAT